MKEINIKFVDFEDNEKFMQDFIIQILKKRYTVKISDNPQYVFFGVCSLEHLTYNCIRILVCGENFCPDFNITDYAIAHEYIEFNDRYLRFPIYQLMPPYCENLIKATNRKLPNLDQKTEFCSFVVSNSWGNKCREKIFKKINEYKHVNSGGRYLNNIGGSVEDKYQFDLKHKFSIACENSSSPGYTTEKIVQAFAANTIPIYWGDPFIEKEFNSKAFINYNNFNSLEELINEVKKVDNNDEIYINMLKEPIYKGDIQKHQKDLENFLYHIFDQPYEKAFRRDRYMFGKNRELQLILFKKYIQKPYLFILNGLRKSKILNIIKFDKIILNKYYKIKHKNE